MNDYSKLDAALLAAIDNGTNTAMAMEWNTKLQLATTPFVSTNKPHYRVIDGRLQSLRRAGKIRFNKKTWELA